MDILKELEECVVERTVVQENIEDCPVDDFYYMPEIDQECFQMLSTSSIHETVWEDTLKQREAFIRGTLFHSRSALEQADNKRKAFFELKVAALREWRNQGTPDRPTWDKTGIHFPKYYCLFKHNESRWIVASGREMEAIGDIYFPTKESAFEWYTTVDKKYPGTLRTLEHNY